MFQSSNSFVLNVQFCKSCDTHNWCTHHDEQKYYSTYRKLKQYLEQEFNNQIFVQGNVVPQELVPIKPKQNKYYNSVTSKYVTYPVIGAFQVLFQKQLLFSKKKTNTWPNLAQIADQIYFILNGRSRKQGLLQQNHLMSVDGDILTQKDNISLKNHSFLDDKRTTIYKPKASQNKRNFTLTDHFKNYHKNHTYNQTNQYQTKNQYENGQYHNGQYQNGQQTLRASDQFFSNQQSNQSLDYITSFRKNQSDFNEFKRNFQQYGLKDKLPEFIKKKAYFHNNDNGKKEMIIKLDSIEEQSILQEAHFNHNISSQTRNTKNMTGISFNTNKSKQSKKKIFLKKFDDDFQELQTKFKKFQQKVQDIREQNKKFDSMPKINEKYARQFKSLQQKDKKLRNKISKNQQNQNTPNDDNDDSIEMDNPIIFARRKLKNIDDYINGTQEQKNKKLKKIYGQWKLLRKPYKGNNHNYVSPYRIDVKKRQKSQKNPAVYEDSSAISNSDDQTHGEFGGKQNKLPKMPTMNLKDQNSMPISQKKFYSTARDQFNKLGNRKLKKSNHAQQQRKQQVETKNFNKTSGIRLNSFIPNNYGAKLGKQRFSPSKLQQQDHKQNDFSNPSSTTRGRKLSKSTRNVQQSTKSNKLKGLNNLKNHNNKFLTEQQNHNIQSSNNDIDSNSFSKFQSAHDQKLPSFSKNKIKQKFKTINQRRKSQQKQNQFNQDQDLQQSDNLNNQRTHKIKTQPKNKNLFTKSGRKQQNQVRFNDLNDQQYNEINSRQAFNEIGTKKGLKQNNLLKKINSNNKKLNKKQFAKKSQRSSEIQKQNNTEDNQIQQNSDNNQQLQVSSTRKQNQKQSNSSIDGSGNVNLKQKQSSVKQKTKNTKKSSQTKQNDKKTKTKNVKQSNRSSTNKSTQNNKNINQQNRSSTFNENQSNLEQSSASDKEYDMSNIRSSIDKNVQRINHKGQDQEKHLKVVNKANKLSNQLQKKNASTKNSTNKHKQNIQQNDQKNSNTNLNKHQKSIDRQDNSQDEQNLNQSKNSQQVQNQTVGNQRQTLQNVKSDNKKSTKSKYNKNNQKQKQSQLICEDHQQASQQNDKNNIKKQSSTKDKTKNNNNQKSKVTQKKQIKGQQSLSNTQNNQQLNSHADKQVDESNSNVKSKAKKSKLKANNKSNELQGSQTLNNQSHQQDLQKTDQIQSTQNNQIQGQNAKKTLQKQQQKADHQNQQSKNQDGADQSIQKQNLKAKNCKQTKNANKKLKNSKKLQLNPNQQEFQHNSNQSNENQQEQVMPNQDQQAQENNEQNQTNNQKNNHQSSKIVNQTKLKTKANKKVNKTSQAGNKQQNALQNKKESVQGQQQQSSNEQIDQQSKSNLNDSGNKQVHSKLNKNKNAQHNKKTTQESKVSQQSNQNKTSLQNSDQKKKAQSTQIVDGQKFSKPKQSDVKNKVLKVYSTNNENNQQNSSNDQQEQQKDKQQKKNSQNQLQSSSQKEHNKSNLTNQQSLTDQKGKINKNTQQKPLQNNNLQENQNHIQNNDQKSIKKGQNQATQNGQANINLLKSKQVVIQSQKQKGQQNNMQSQLTKQYQNNKQFSTNQNNHISVRQSQQTQNKISKQCLENNKTIISREQKDINQTNTIKNSANQRLNQQQNIFQNVQIQNDAVLSQQTPIKQVQKMSRQTNQVSQFDQSSVEKAQNLNDPMNNTKQSQFTQQNDQKMKQTSDNIMQNAKINQKNIKSKVKDINGKLNDNGLSSQNAQTSDNFLQSSLSKACIQKPSRAPIMSQLYGASIVKQSSIFPQQSSLSFPSPCILQTHPLNTHSEAINSSEYILFDSKSIEADKILQNHCLIELVKVVRILAEINQFLIVRLFENPAIQRQQAYGVWLCVHYQWKCIILKPEIIVADHQQQKPYYLEHTNRQLWPLILQRALAIALGGYDKLLALPCHKLFNILTGSNSLFFNIKQDPTKNTRILRYISDCENKNFVIHAEKVCRNLDDLQRKQKQVKIYYVLSSKTVNDGEVLIQVRENNHPQSMWMKLHRFVVQFKSLKILQLPLNHNSTSLSIRPPTSNNLSIIQLQFFNQSFGSITLSSNKATNLRTYLYKEEKSNVLKLVGQAKEKNKNTLFFDCYFAQAKYYLFVQCTNQARVTYLGENQPFIRLVEEINANGLKNNYTEYLPIKNTHNKENSHIDMPKVIKKAKMGSTGMSFKNQQDKIVKLRQNFVEYLLEGRVQGRF